MIILPFSVFRPDISKSYAESTHAHGLSAQRDYGGEAGRASPPPEDAVPPRGGGHHGAAVCRHLQVPPRHELLIVEENEMAQVK